MKTAIESSREIPKVTPRFNNHFDKHEGYFDRAAQQFIKMCILHVMYGSEEPDNSVDAAARLEDFMLSVQHSNGDSFFALLIAMAKTDHANSYSHDFVQRVTTQILKQPKPQALGIKATATATYLEAPVTNKQIDKWFTAT